ncbi:MAG: LTA synthase family protein [Bacteroidetes bacterium]|nr:LTA synthase family protein [Bacteroidota bacterium]
MKKIKLDIYSATALRLLIVMFIFQLSRLGFFISNIESFEKTTFTSYLNIMRGGIFFDLAAVLYMNIIFIAMEVIPFKFRHNKTYQTIAKWVFIIFNSVSIFVNTIDYIYFKYTFKRTTFMIFNEFKNEQNKGNMILEFIADYWYCVLLIILLILLMIWLYNRIEIKKPTIKKGIYYYLFCLAIMALSATLFIGGVRGGFAHSTRPITISNATEYSTNDGEEFIVLNTPFSVLRTMGEEKLPESKFFNKKELAELYSPIHMPTCDTMRKKNVVILILESFGKEYIGKLNENKNIENYKSYTPFLDSLIGESMYFEYSFSNGKKSIEAMPSVLASIPSLTKPFILSGYSQNKYNSINSRLKENGYTTLFYHGAPNGSMGFSAFANKIGTEYYVGKDEYNNDDDFDGLWSIWDKPFLDFMATDLSKRKAPFIATVFTASSHHPYKVPEEYEGKFDKGDIPMHQVIGYSDYALRNFFKRAKEQDWYKNTLFVFTADHTNLNFYKEYSTPAGRYSIPILFFTPNGELKGKRNETIQQADITPTILDYLNYNKPYFSFGTSKLKPSEDMHIAVIYYNNHYYGYNNNYLMIFDGTKNIGMYDYMLDVNLNHDISEEQPELENEMENKMKAFVQTYNNSLIHDKMEYNSFITKE